LAVARAFGYPYDPMRLELFESLFAALQSQTYPSFPDQNTTLANYRNFAFFESYFSNYIEGTEFELKDAKSIIETNQPLPARNEDSHDILGTFYIVSNREEMKRTPSSADELFDLLQSRHRVMLSARQDKMPGMFKSQNNRAGNTHFVDFNLVRGTLMKGFEFYRALQHPFTRAVFMMFMVSETHPFNDGNGRIARIMMNAELTCAAESKIIVPTVFRNDYLLALRKLSRQHKPDAYIRAMLKVWQFSATLYGEDADAMELALRQANAFADPEENVLNWGNVIA
ncbi:MAG: Fic family protein, partial [Bacteroides sp.]|nr:Fic family protein [Bacteroides sp.]